MCTSITPTMEYGMTPRRHGDGRASTCNRVGSASNWRLSHLYLAASCVWRYQAEADPKMLPIARAAIRVQLDLAAATLRDLYANLPSRALRWLAPLLLHGTRHLAPLRDRDLIAQSDALRDDHRLLASLCPDVTPPALAGCTIWPGHLSLPSRSPAKCLS